METILINTKYIPNNVTFKIDMKSYNNIICVSNRKTRIEHLLNINIIFLDNIEKYYRLQYFFNPFFINILKIKINSFIYLKIIDNIIIPKDQKTDKIIKYMLNIKNSYLYSLYICNFNKIECLFSDDKNMFYKTLNKIINKKMIKKQKKIEILYIDLNN